MRQSCAILGLLKILELTMAATSAAWDYLSYSTGFSGFFGKEVWQSVGVVLHQCCLNTLHLVALLTLAQNHCAHYLVICHFSTTNFYHITRHCCKIHQRRCKWIERFVTFRRHLCQVCWLLLINWGLQPSSAGYLSEARAPCTRSWHDHL